MKMEKIFIRNGKCYVIENGVTKMDVTAEVGRRVKPTMNGGIIMWSENDHTYIAAYEKYVAVYGEKPCYIRLSGHWIPHCWDTEVRRNLGLQ